MSRSSFRKAAAAVLVLSLAGCLRPRGPGGTGAPGKAVAEFDLTSGVPESVGGGLFQQPASRTFVALARAVEKAADDSDVAGAFVKIGATTLSWAQAEELGALFGKLKAKNKPVVCHAHVLSNPMSAFALRGCTKTWLSPAGEAETIGIAAQVMYMRGLFDRLKIGVDFLHVGKFKSGVEPFTREGPSDEARQSLTETLAAIRESWLAQATEAGKPGTVRDALEAGPWGATEAKAQGLVDQVGFESEALEEAKKLASATSSASRYGGGKQSGGGLDVAEIIRLIAGSENDSAGRTRIAVVPAEGAIAMESGGPFDSGGITLRALAKTVRKLKNDDGVKAVVLRIDSPGGSALASDLLWHELTELRKKKPLVVSVGGMAASGGYYLACAAQRILAEPTSIVGSIGVFGGKIVLSTALEPYGIHTETFPASPAPGAAARAAVQSPFSEWDEPTRERVRAEMQGIYDLFVTRVSDSRKLPRDRVEAVAQGRIWSGKQGLERGLVDELGGVHDAIRVARGLAKLPDDAVVSVEGTQESLLEMLLVDEGASEAEVRRAVASLESRSLVLREFPEVARRFAAAAGPLASGERVVAALPFGVTIQ